VEARSIWRDIWLEEAHHSTAIEGNTLVQKQVEKLLDEGRAVGNKELREYLEVRGYAPCARLVWEVAPHPGAGEQERPGSFRQHDIEPDSMLASSRYIRSSTVTGGWADSS
jgi:hypothetical protein